LSNIGGGLKLHCTQRGFINAEGINLCLGLNEWGFIYDQAEMTGGLFLRGIHFSLRHRPDKCKGRLWSFVFRKVDGRPLSEVALSSEDFG